MLSVFPQILFLAPLAATMLRIVAALTFAYVAWRQAARHDELAQFRFPIIGAGGWIVWFVVIVEAAIAGLLFIGLYTQVAALVGAIAALKSLYWHRKVPALAPLAGGTSFLLLVILLSLVVTGGGPFALDLPL